VVFPTIVDCLLEVLMESLGFWLFATIAILPSALLAIFGKSEMKPIGYDKPSVDKSRLP
jgi:hypothetical protein